MLFTTHRHVHLRVRKAHGHGDLHALLAGGLEPGRAKHDAAQHPDPHLLLAEVVAVMR
jgi:hypothetical protein